MENQDVLNSSLSSVVLLGHVCVYNVGITLPPSSIMIALFLDVDQAPEMIGVGLDPWETNLDTMFPLS